MKKQDDDLLRDFGATAEIGATGVWIGLNDRVTEGKVLFLCTMQVI